MKLTSWPVVFLSRVCSKHVMELHLQCSVQAPTGSLCHAWYNDLLQISKFKAFMHLATPFEWFVAWGETGKKHFVVEGRWYSHNVEAWQHQLAWPDRILWNSIVLYLCHYSLADQAKHQSHRKGIFAKQSKTQHFFPLGGRHHLNLSSQWGDYDKYYSQT